VGGHELLEHVLFGALFRSLRGGTREWKKEGAAATKRQQKGNGPASGEALVH
jgi:hypothetical protein